MAKPSRVRGSMPGARTCQVQMMAARVVAEYCRRVVAEPLRSPMMTISACAVSLAPPSRAVARRPESNERGRHSDNANEDVGRPRRDLVCLYHGQCQIQDE